MYTRLLTPPVKTSFFLFGPRGVGKTTWVKHNFPRAIYIDFLHGKTFTQLFANPSRIEEMIPNNFTDWIVVDEVQRVPELLNEVHRLIESRHYKFVLTGSSARKLRRGGTNLLAGRASTLFMHPLTAVELGDDFDFTSSLRFGSLPAVLTQEDKDAYLASYVATYVQQEVIQEGVSRNLGAFTRFLETASFSQGSVLTMSDVAREASVGRRMTENYFSALEDLLIGVRIPVFAKRAKRKLIAHQKFYFFDTGIYRTIRPASAFDQPEEIGGICLETLVMQNLRAVNDYLKLGYTMYYYRTITGGEVDFILYGPKGLLAFEVKRKRDIFPKDITGLKMFIEDYPTAKAYVLYGGQSKRYVGNVEVWPIAEALKNFPELLG
ncbi:ATP-binding protein [Candidatus Gottesmanbacteria bacterium]|nr:ATP-binding protein [Candidatus Gottesmanbacteria bacterium]